MDWDNYIKLLSAAFGVIGAGLVAYSTLSPECLVELAKMHFDIHADLLDALVHEKATKITGFKFVALAFILTALSMCVPKNQRCKSWAYMLLGGFSLALAVTVLDYRGTIYKNNKEGTEKSVRAYYENDVPEAVPSACSSL